MSERCLARSRNSAEGGGLFWVGVDVVAGRPDRWEVLSLPGELSYDDARRVLTAGGTGTEYLVGDDGRCTEVVGFTPVRRPAPVVLDLRAGRSFPPAPPPTRAYRVRTWFRRADGTTGMSGGTFDAASPSAAADAAWALVLGAEPGATWEGLEVWLA